MQMRENQRTSTGAGAGDGLCKQGVTGSIPVRSTSQMDTPLAVIDWRGLVFPQIAFRWCHKWCQKGRFSAPGGYVARWLVRLEGDRFDIAEVRTW